MKEPDKLLTLVEAYQQAVSLYRTAAQNRENQQQALKIADAAAEAAYNQMQDALGKLFDVIGRPPQPWVLDHGKSELETA